MTHVRQFALKQSKIILHQQASKIRDNLSTNNPILARSKTENQFNTLFPQRCPHSTHKLQTNKRKTKNNIIESITILSEKQLMY